MKMSANEFILDVCDFVNCNINYLSNAPFKDRWGGGTVEPAVGQLLYLLARHKAPKLAIEYGTNLGYSTYMIAKALFDNGFGELVTMEINSEYIKEAKKNVYDAHIAAYNNHVSFLKADSTSVYAKKFIEDNREVIDLVFVDSSHEYDQTLEEFRHIRKTCKPGTILCFHDIYSDGVSRVLREEPFDKYLAVPTQPNTGFGIVIL